MAFATRAVTLLILISATGCASIGQAAFQGRGLRAVAAENFYGDVVNQIGGSRVQIVSFLHDPNADPHDFEASPRNSILVAEADLVVMNGLGYDSWMQHLIDSAPSDQRTTLIAGEIAGKRIGSNPHIWYNFAFMRRLAGAIANQLSQHDPAHASYFRDRARKFNRSLSPIVQELRRVRIQRAGSTVAQTEPVFAYVLHAAGLNAPEGAFQRSIEEGSDPPPGSVIQLEGLLRRGVAKALIYNAQTVKPITQTVRSIARAAGVPVIPITEMEPAALSYQEWMRRSVRALARALHTAASP